MVNVSVLLDMATEMLSYKIQSPILVTHSRSELVHCGWHAGGRR